MTPNCDSDDSHTIELFKEYFLSEKYLWGTAEAKKYPASFSNQQINLLTQITNDQKLRKACFDLAEKGMADCQDNAASAFQEMQKKTIECEMMKPGISQTELIQFAMALKNQEKLMQLIVDTPEIKRGFVTGESLEAHSALCLLCHELNIRLPTPVTAMLYEETGWEQFRNPETDQGLISSDIKARVSRLLLDAFFSDDGDGQAESMAQFLATQAFWQRHIDRINSAHHEKITAINVDSAKKQDDLFNDLNEYKKAVHTEAELKSKEITTAHEMQKTNQQRVEVICDSYLAETKKLLSQQQSR